MEFTLHNEHGDYLHDTARTLKSARYKCNLNKRKCKVMETYFAPSPFNKNIKTLHGKEVYRNY